MDKKINTEEAQIFVSAYYKNKDVASEPQQWELVKKYKNFKGLTCRDFFYQEKQLKCIVVFDEITSAIQLIENEDYQFFLKQAASLPVFYYVPTICNDGLVFYFEPVAQIDRFGKPAIDTNKYKALLQKKLVSLFTTQGLYSLSSGLFFAFPNTDMDEAVGILEKNQFSFNLKLFEFLEPKIFQPIIPDVTLAKYKFPEDDKLDQEQIIALIFSIISKKKKFSDADYAHIRSLLKRLPLDEFPIITKIALGFKSAKDKKIISLFESESNRRKAQDIIKKIWKAKTK